MQINTCTAPPPYLRWGCWGNGFLTRPIYLTDMEHGLDTRVLFNANCPVCNFEIGHYARYADQSRLPIRFDDLNTDARDQWGIDADTAARRLYVLHDGVLSSGIPAFLVLWALMPRYRLLGRVVGLPGIKQVATATYDHLLAPTIYRWHLHRVKKQANRAKQA
jgi:hypothetical protein